jgi:hypothetical protein
MLKNCILLLYIWVSAFSQAQSNYYNKTIDIENSINANEDLFILNQDTSILTGFLRDANGKRSNTYTFINNQNGDTIRSFRYGRDTIDIYGGIANNIHIINNMLFSCGAYYKNNKAYSNFLKFTLDGNILLDSVYFEQLYWSEFECILPTNDGNFLITGSKITTLGNRDGLLVKIDQNGNILWEKTFNYSTYDGAIKIVPHLDNFLISAGNKDHLFNEIDLWLICVDHDGNIVWEKTFGGPYYDGGNAISISNNEIHVSGCREYASNKYESFIMRLNSVGELVWEKSLFRLVTPHAQSDLSHSIELSDGSIVMGGTTYENDSPVDYPIARIFKMNQNGDSLWTRILKLRNNDNYLTDIKELENGDLLISGFVFPDSPNNTQDGWLMRTNCLGYFEHPKDSIVMSGIGENVLSLTNYSSYYDYTIVNWGDNSSDTVYASGNQNIMHEYTLPGNYSINTTTIACNDTIHKSSEYLVIPEQYESSELVIFPNPNQGHFEIWLDSPDLYSLEIMDLNGRIVKSALNVKMNQGYIIDLSELGRSIYFVRAAKGENIIQQRVLVIS